jgi:hypothetical protein
MSADLYPSKSVRRGFRLEWYINLNSILFRVHLVKCIIPDSTYGIPKCNSSCLTICHYLIFGTYITKLLSGIIHSAVEIRTPSHALLTPWALFLNMKFIEEMLYRAITSASVTNHPLSSHALEYKPSTTSYITDTSSGRAKKLMHQASERRSYFNGQFI